MCEMDGVLFLSHSNWLYLSYGPVIVHPDEWIWRGRRKKKRCWAVMSCRSSVFRADQRLDNRGWSVFDMETNDLPFCWEGMADVWLIFGGRWWEKGKRKHSWLFFVPSLSCYHIKLETDHCSNALTGMFFFGAFQLDVSVSNNMNPGGWWGVL